ncbi:MAG: hypothetical protein HDR12_06370 [Lachnospiraceae bacterium]|nr:hypothetical protein [Lachnospiraceae bacterium]
MVNILKIVILKIIGMLPDSPISSYLDNVNADFFDYLNWFLPIDVCGMIFGVWLICIGIFYIYLIIKQITKLIIEGIAKAASIATFFV